jgi:hypothetical protein
MARGAPPPEGRTADDDHLLALLRTYLQDNTKLDAPERSYQEAAADEVSRLEQNDPEKCWRLLELSCAENLPDDRIAFLAAGPFENLLGNHGAAFVERVEIAARRSEHMRFLVATVWRGGMNAAIWERVLKLRERLGITPQ